MTPRTDGFGPVLDALADDAERCLGDSKATIDPVSRMERPFSALLRLRVTTRTATSHVFLKMYKPRPPVPYEPPTDLSQMVQEEFAATQRMYLALNGRPGLAAPRPLAVFPDHQAIVTEEVEGESFDRLLRAEAWRMTPSRMLQAVATRIGAWIREYQRVCPASGHLSLAAQREYLDERLRHITPRILSADERARALDLFDQLAADIETAMAELARAAA